MPSSTAAPAKLRLYLSHSKLRLRSGARLVRTLILLAEAARNAHRSGRNRWQFSVEIQQFVELGLQVNDLRFMVRMQLVNYACEMKPRGPAARRFRRTGDVCFTNDTCFVLTNLGLLMSRGLFGSNGRPQLAKSAKLLANTSVQKAVSQAPVWDATHRMLTMDGVTLKMFKRPADNQELILSVFHEEGWPRRIDDPLPPVEAVDSKQRLNNAIKCLNRNHLLRAIHFCGDGTGQGIVWQVR